MKELGTVLTLDHSKHYIRYSESALTCGAINSLTYNADIHLLTKLRPINTSVWTIFLGEPVVGFFEVAIAQEPLVRAERRRVLIYAEEQHQHRGKLRAE